MPEFFRTTKQSFDFLANGGWRAPQLGALGAILSHWSLARDEPTLVSLPTGTGKTAIALAAPFLAPKVPERVLVLASSRQLRQQLVQQFQSYATLAQLGALPNTRIAPNVYEMKGHCSDWRELEAYDVVVALPNSISPLHYEVDSQPPAGLFDLLIVDEAHHSPARTWTAILDHFAQVPALLLTATPQRRDGRRIPGSLEYYYPLRRALDEGIYQQITPVLLQADADGGDRDQKIAREAANLLDSHEHSNSALLVRAGSVERLRELHEVYAVVGVQLHLLYHRLAASTQSHIVEKLRTGDIRAVGVVGMLGEGFDLPALRLLSYHDKHRSVPATMQLIGRLARADPAYPQASKLITVADNDVYPELKGVLRTLYEEDADWADVLPGILDTEIAAEQDDRQFVRGLPESTNEIDPTYIAPIKRALVYEVPASWVPDFLRDIPQPLATGQRLLGGEVMFTGVIEEAKMLVTVVRYTNRPKWSTDPALANVCYELHVAIYRRPQRRTQPGFVLLNLDRGGAKNVFESVLGLKSVATLASPERLGGYIDSLNRVSVSSVGMRNTNAATRGRASYRNYMGSAVDRGLRNFDLNRSALGHVMFQTDTASGSANAGAAVEKSKIWLARYGPLRELSAWADAAAGLLWNPKQVAQGPLLPGIERGHRFEEWPRARPLAAEIPPSLLGLDFELWDQAKRLGLIEDLDLYVNSDPTGSLDEIAEPEPRELQIIGVFNDRQAGTETCVWQAKIEVGGRVTASHDLYIRHGYGESQPLSDVFEQHPPTIYFLNGATTIGALRYDNRARSSSFDIGLLNATAWDGVDVTAETRKTATKHGRNERSIHERLEEYLLECPRRGSHRWILCNDGAGEFADYLVVEDGTATGEIALGLWHAKRAGGSASVRIGDFQIVVAQALRSRGILPSTALWEHLGKRLDRTESPWATLVHGSDDASLLRERLGLEEHPGGDGDSASWVRSLPVVSGTIGIAQPGLSASMLRREIESGSPSASAEGLRQLFSVLQDTAISDGADLQILVSQ